MYLSIYLSIYQSIVFIHPSINPSFFSIHLSIYPSIYLSIYLSVCLPVCLSICPPVYLQLENKAILRDFFIFQTRQHQKRSNSARRDFLNFRRWQHQKRYNSARLPSKMEVGCSADGLVPMRFAIFPLHLSKVLRLPRKIDARSYKVLHLSRKIILANLQI